MGDYQELTEENSLIQRSQLFVTGDRKPPFPRLTIPRPQYLTACCDINYLTGKTYKGKSETHAKRTLGNRYCTDTMKGKRQGRGVLS